MWKYVIFCIAVWPHATNLHQKYYKKIFYLHSFTYSLWRPCTCCIYIYVYCCSNYVLAAYLHRDQQPYFYLNHYKGSALLNVQLYYFILVLGVQICPRLAVYWQQHKWCFQFQVLVASESYSRQWLVYLACCSLLVLHSEIKNTIICVH